MTIHYKFKDRFPSTVFLTPVKILAAKDLQSTLLSPLRRVLALSPCQGSFYPVLNNFLAQHSPLQKAMVGCTTAHLLLMSY